MSKEVLGLVGYIAMCAVFGGFVSALVAISAWLIAGFVMPLWLFLIIQAVAPASVVGGSIAYTLYQDSQGRLNA